MMHKINTSGIEIPKKITHDSKFLLTGGHRLGVVQQVISVQLCHYFGWFDVHHFGLGGIV